MVSFWKKSSGNLFSAKSGLTTAQVEFLRQLKPGDRLVIWVNEEEDAPDFTLRLYKQEKSTYL